MSRKELIERLRCLPLDEPAEFTAVMDAVVVPRKWRGGREKRFRWRRLRWGWGSQTFEFLSDGKAVTFWEWEEPKPRAPHGFHEDQALQRLGRFEKARHLLRASAR